MPRSPGDDRLERRLVDAHQLALQRCYLVWRAVGEAEADDDGLDVVVGEDRDQRGLEARHHQQLVDGTDRPVGAHGACPELQRRLLDRPHRVDHQHLEIGPAMRRHPRRMLGRLGLALVVGAVLAGAQRDRAGDGRRRSTAPARSGRRAERDCDSPRSRAAGAARRSPRGRGTPSSPRSARAGRAPRRRCRASEPRRSCASALRQSQGIVLEPVPGVGAQLAGVVVLAEGELAALRPGLFPGLAHPDIPPPASLHRSLRPPIAPSKWVWRVSRRARWKDAPDARSLAGIATSSDDAAAQPRLGDAIAIQVHATAA